MKKALIFITYFLLAGILSAQPNWEIIDVSMNDDLIAVIFTDADHGWIAAEPGSIYLTDDGGESWNPCYTSTNTHLHSIYFSDNENGWAVGWKDAEPDSSLILITHNGGESWLLAEHPLVNCLNDVFFIDDQSGWVVGNIGEQQFNCFLHTTDGGDTWMAQTSPLVVNANLFSVSFRDGSLGSTCGNNGAFFITNSGGADGWAMDISFPVVQLNDIYNFGAQNGCIVGEGGLALYTINNWYQYIEQTSNTIEDLHAVDGVSGTPYLWAVGNNGTIIYSANYLFAWEIQASGTTEHLQDICMISLDNGWAVGDNGTVLHFTGNMGTDENHVQSTAKFYPNPAKSGSTLLLPYTPGLQYIELISMNGKALLKKVVDNQSTTIKLKLPDNIHGVFLIKVANDNNVNYQKLVIH